METSKSQALVGGRNFLEEVMNLPGGEKIQECIQCGICTGSCPAAAEMDYPPRRVIAMVRAGLRDEVLSTSSMWHCVSCYLCTTRCPRGVKPTEILHTLESLAIRERFVIKDTKTPKMYQSFVDSVKSNGRVHELGFMLSYFLKTNPFAAFKMTSQGVQMLTHRLLPLRATRVKGRTELKAIRDKTKAMGGA